MIGDEYDAVFNIDSETVFMKPFDISMWINNGKYMMYRIINENEPSHDDYCHAADMAMAPPTASLAKGKADARGNTQSRLHLSSARQSYVSW